jgi:hypothetical protein
VHVDVHLENAHAGAPCYGMERAGAQRTEASKSRTSVAPSLIRGGASAEEAT